MQLGLGPASEQAFLRGVWSSSSSLSFCGRNSLGNAFQAARPSCGAVVCIAHDGEPGGSDREHDAVATVLIIGASRGIGLEAVKAALEAGHSVRALTRSARRIPIDHPKLEKMARNCLARRKESGSFRTPKLELKGGTGPRPRRGLFLGPHRPGTEWNAQNENPARRIARSLEAPSPLLLK